MVEGQEVPALPRRTNTHSPPNAPSLLETVPFLNIFIGSLLSSGYSYGSHQGPQASLVSPSHLPPHSFPFPWRKEAKAFSNKGLKARPSEGLLVEDKRSFWALLPAFGYLQPLKFLSISSRVPRISNSMLSNF